MEIKQKHFIFSFAKIYESFEQSAQRLAEMLESQTKDDFKRISDLEEAKYSRIQEFSKSLQAEKKWSFISSAAQTAAAGTSLAIGAASLAQGKSTVASMCMLASGVASLAGKALQYTGAFQKMASWMTSSKEMEAKIASRLETGTQCTALGLGLAGGIASVFQSPVMRDSLAKAWPWTSSLLGFAPRTIELKKSFTERQSAHISASLQRSESLIMQIYQRIHQTGKDAERLFYSLGEICESLKSAIYTQQMRI